ncbi:integrase, catalytic region, zinc finger, CCHC-type containing protein [Tanacetum coccineum]
MDEYHEVHEMQSDVQHNYVVDSDADYTSDSNIIPYDQYMEDNEEHVVQSNVSSILRKTVGVVEQYGETSTVLNCKEKNLLIENEKLIANCLSNQLLYDVEKSRCLYLEAEMSKVQNESKHISKLEREYLNLQLKYQHLQESFDNNKSQTSQEAPDFNSFFKIKNLKHQIQEKDNVIRDLKVLVANVNDRSCETYNAKDVTALIEQNECVRVELEKKSKVSCFASDSVKPKVLAPSMEIVEEARVVKPLDNALNYACQYTKLSQELLEYVIGTCPKSFNERDNKAPATPVTRKKQVTFNDKPGTSSSNTQKHEVHQKVQQTNVFYKIYPMIHSTGVNSTTKASGSTPRSNTKKNRILPAKTENKKKVEDHPRTNKSVWTKVNWVDSSISSKRVVINSNSESVCKTCCSKHMTGNRSKLKNFVEKFIGTVRFGNDHFRAIMGYGDYVIGDSAICDTDLERFAFRKHSCFVRDINGADLLKGSRSINLYTISIDDIMKSSPICLLFKASKSKSWLWYHRLNHLNFSTINDLAQKDLVRGLPRLKFEKDHLCSACQLGKTVLMEEIHFSAIVGLNKTVRYIRTDNGTEFVNQVMSKYYEGVGIFHQKSVSRTPQQNGVVERRNHTLVEAARTMLIFLKAPMFLWAEAVATACYTQNRSLIHTRHNKTPYELVHDKKPDLTFLRVFGALCYPTNDSKNRNIHSQSYIGIFVGYAPSRKGYRIFNKRTRRLMETIHVTFDEMHPTMAPVRMSSGPEPIIMTPGQLKSGLAPTDKELEMLFQPMFDEYVEQSRVNELVPSATAVNTQVVPPGTSLSTTIAQDAPSTSASSSTSYMHHLVRHQGIVEKPTLEDSLITHDALHPSFNPVTGEPGLT